MILNQGYLIKGKSTSNLAESYYMKLIEPREINMVVNLQQLVYDGLPNKEVLYMDTKNEMLEDLYNGAMIIGVFNDIDQLISYRYVSFPGNSSKNLGNDISMSTSELDRVVHLETTLVRPDYRGNKLQSITLNQAVDLIKPLDMKHVLCTVSPYNLFSLFNIMSSGMNIKALKRKYGNDNTNGMWRFILHKDIGIDLAKHSQEFKSVKMDHIREQKNLIEKGYVGYNLVKENKMIQYSLSY